MATCFHALVSFLWDILNHLNDTAQKIRKFWARKYNTIVQYLFSKTIMRTLCVSWDPDGLALRKKGAPHLLGSAPCVLPSLAVHLVPVGIWRPTADQCSYFLPTTWQDEGCGYLWASFSQSWHHSLHFRLQILALGTSMLDYGRLSACIQTNR